MKQVLKKIASIVFAPILENGKFSIGRWGLVVSLSIAWWKWMHSINIPDSHQTIIVVFAGYVLGTKGLTTIKDAIGAYKAAKAATSKSEEQK